MDVHFDSLKCPRCPRLVVLVPIAAIEVAAAQLEVSELRVNIYSLASFFGERGRLPSPSPGMCQQAEIMVLTLDDVWQGFT